MSDTTTKQDHDQSAGRSPYVPPFATEEERAAFRDSLLKDLAAYLKASTATRADRRD
jgi:hypothetical protein